MKTKRGCLLHPSSNLVKVTYAQARRTLTRFSNPSQWAGSLRTRHAMRVSLFSTLAKIIHVAHFWRWVNLRHLSGLSYERCRRFLFAERLPSSSAESHSAERIEALGSCGSFDTMLRIYSRTVLENTGRYTNAGREIVSRP
jgi:hypothetical protein